MSKHETAVQYIKILIGILAAVLVLIGFQRITNILAAIAYNTSAQGFEEWCLKAGAQYRTTITSKGRSIKVCVSGFEELKGIEIR